MKSKLKTSNVIQFSYVDVSGSLLLALFSYVLYTLKVFLCFSRVRFLHFLSRISKFLSRPSPLLTLYEVVVLCFVASAGQQC